MLLSKVAVSPWFANEELSTVLAHRPLRYVEVKEAVDRIAAFVLLILLSPVFFFVAVCVKLSSRGPIIFRQERLTVGGQKFTMLKFRSMVNDAESETGPVWAKAKDPRITPIGKLLRKTRLDELPQLINVIRGEMSLIGPRPERPEIAEDLAQQLPNFRRRLDVKAGITGLAQVQCGYSAGLRSYSVKLDYDTFYVENVSLLLDLKIALKTVFVIFSCSGAR